MTATPAVHPDVVRDLAPLHAAGEASAATAALVEAAAAADPALARELEALRRAVRLGASPSPAADLEERALGEMRRAVRRRSGWLAGATFCSLLPLTFFYSGDRIVFLALRDAPVMAVGSLVAAAAMWIAFARTARAVR
jgi:anti-sigma factor RsiW